MKHSDFKEPQSVKIRDKETGEWIRGIVSSISVNSVTIKWEDLAHPAEHGESDYHLIVADNDPDDMPKELFQQGTFNIFKELITYFEPKNDTR